MKVALSLYLLLFSLHISACSNRIDDTNSGSFSPKPDEHVVLNSKANPPKATGPSNKIPSPNPRDVIYFDGKNYKKKGGWKTPSRENTYIDESYDQDKVEGVTESGREVRTNTILYLYEIPWLYSQDFYYDGRDLDYLKGKLESFSFRETSVNRKVFMYSISTQKVVETSSSMNNPHEDPFGYQIQDRDGDGIFETLLGKHDDEIIVPNWVLK